MAKSIITDPTDPKKVASNKVEYYNKYLPDTYGKGVINRQDYIDLAYKPIGGNTITATYDVDENSKYLPESLRPIQSRYKEKAQRLNNYKKEIEEEITLSPNFIEHPTTPMEYRLQELQRKGDITSEEYQAYVDDAYNMRSAEVSKVFNEFLNHPDATYTRDVPQTTWRDLVNKNTTIRNKELFLASLMDEGANVFTTDYKGEDSTVIPGYQNFGLDTTWENAEDFARKGYLDKSVLPRLREVRITNEKGESYRGANYDNLEDVVAVKSAYLQDAEAKIKAKAASLGINLQPEALDYFTIASFNAGLGNAIPMLEAYNKTGILKNNKYLEDDSYGGYREIHRNVKRRIETSNMLKGEGVLTGKAPFVPNYKPYPREEDLSPSIARPVKQGTVFQGVPNFVPDYITSPKMYARGGYTNKSIVRPRSIKKDTEFKLPPVKSTSSHYFDRNAFRKGIAFAETGSTREGVGKYKHFYDDIKDLELLQGVSIEDFMANDKLQDTVMNLDILGNLDTKVGGYQNAKDLTIDYKEQLGDKWNYRPDEIAALSHYLGRSGAREYFQSTIDKIPVDSNVETYLNKYNEGAGLVRGLLNSK